MCAAGCHQRTYNPRNNPRCNPRGNPHSTLRGKPRGNSRGTLVATLVSIIVAIQVAPNVATHVATLVATHVAIRPFLSMCLGQEHNFLFGLATKIKCMFIYISPSYSPVWGGRRSLQNLVQNAIFWLESYTPKRPFV